jgi:rod shape-determining protein MreC
MQKLCKGHQYAADMVRYYQDAYHELLSENIALQGQLTRAEAFDELHDFAKRYDTQYMVAAEVLLHNMTAKEQYILVEGGQNRGIVSDMVAVYKNCILGRVTHVFPYISKVILITDNRCKIAAACAETGATGICQGANTNNGEIELTYVSHLDTVAPGDQVLSRGKELVFPAGFGLGAVKEASCQGLFYHITLEPLIDVMDVSACYLMRPGAEHES